MNINVNDVIGLEPVLGFAPIMDAITKRGETPFFVYAFSSMQGCRDYMEDRYAYFQEFKDLVLPPHSPVLETQPPNATSTNDRKSLNNSTGSQKNKTSPAPPVLRKVASWHETETEDKNSANANSAGQLHLSSSNLSPNSPLEDNPSHNLPESYSTSTPTITSGPSGMITKKPSNAKFVHKNFPNKITNPNKQNKVKLIHFSTVTSSSETAIRKVGSNPNISQPQNTNNPGAANSVGNGLSNIINNGLAPQTQALLPSGAALKGKKIINNNMTVLSKKNTNTDKDDSGDEANENLFGILADKDDTTWHLSMFGVFDGHGGSFCVDYVKENLLSKIIQDEKKQLASQPQNPAPSATNNSISSISSPEIVFRKDSTIKDSFSDLDKEFLKKCSECSSGNSNNSSFSGASSGLSISGNGSNNNSGNNNQNGGNSNSILSTPEKKKNFITKHTSIVNKFSQFNNIHPKNFNSPIKIGKSSISVASSINLSSNSSGSSNSNSSGPSNSNSTSNNPSSNSTSIVAIPSSTAPSLVIKHSNPFLRKTPTSPGPQQSSHSPATGSKFHPYNNISTNKTLHSEDVLFLSGEEDPIFYSGSTANTAILKCKYSNTEKKCVIEIIDCNVGDSRCFVYNQGKTTQLSQDHKPHVESEKSRIQGAGGVVESGRVNGMLAVSRAFGDFDFKKNSKLPLTKQAVIATPEIKRKFIIVEAIAHRPQQFLPFNYHSTSLMSSGAGSTPNMSPSSSGTPQRYFKPGNPKTPFSRASDSPDDTNINNNLTTPMKSATSGNFCDSPTPMLGYESGEEDSMLHSATTPVSSSTFSNPSNSNCSSPGGPLRNVPATGNYYGNSNVANKNNRAHTPMDMAFENKVSFLIMGTDGVFDVMTNEEITKFVLDELRAFQQNPTTSTTNKHDDDPANRSEFNHFFTPACLAAISEKLLQHVIVDLTSCDNVSICIVLFNISPNNHGQHVRK